LTFDCKALADNIDNSEKDIYKGNKVLLTFCLVKIVCVMFLFKKIYKDPKCMLVISENIYNTKLVYLPLYSQKLVKNDLF